MTPSLTGVAASQSYVFILLLLATGSLACFIRNCPMGGKRSLERVNDVPLQRKCLRCGPEDLGQCIGPYICCGSSFGCFINTAESAPCRRENEIPTPCQVEGQICGQEGDGYCVADNVCCNDEVCRIDETCVMTSGRKQLFPDTLHYLKQLLLRQHKPYTDRR